MSKTLILYLFAHENVKKNTFKSTAKNDQVGSDSWKFV